MILVSLGLCNDIPIDRQVMLVGRDETCDAVVDSRRVSRLHCCLAIVNNRLMIRDLDSTNGLKVNGVKVSESVLTTGDEVLLGDCPFRVRDEEEERSADFVERARRVDGNQPDPEDRHPLSLGNVTIPIPGDAARSRLRSEESTASTERSIDRKPIDPGGETEDFTWWPADPTAPS